MILNLNTRALGFVFAGLAASSLFAGSHNRYATRVVDDMWTHLEYARKDIKDGHYQKADAHLSLILINKPLKIATDWQGVGEDYRQGYQDVEGGAINLWSKALGKGTFEFSGRQTTPDITIHFVDKLDQQGQDLSGLVKWKRSVFLYQDYSAYSKTTADIWLRTVRPDGGRMNFQQMRAALAHELGHVLGLADRDEVGDLMGEMDLDHPAMQVSESDLDALMALRSEAKELYASIDPQLKLIARRKEEASKPTIKFKLGV